MEKSGITQGNCLVIDTSEALSLDLAKKSKLRIYLIHPDQKTVDAMRLKIDKAGKYGQVTCRAEDPNDILFPTWFFDLVVVNNVKLDGSAFSEAFRLIKPGKMGIFIKSGDTAALSKKHDAPCIKTTKIEPSNGFTLVRKGYEQTNEYLSPPLARLWVTCEARKGCYFPNSNGRDVTGALYGDAQGEVLKDRCMNYVPLDAYTGKRVNSRKTLKKVIDRSDKYRNDSPYRFGGSGHGGGEYTGHAQQTYAVNRKTGKVAWVFVDNLLYRGKCARPIPAAGAVYKSHGRTLLALDMHTGELLSHYRHGGDMCATPLVARSILYQPNTQFRVQAFVSDSKKTPIPKGDILTMKNSLPPTRHSPPDTRHSSDWPMFHYDAQRTGVSPDKTIKPPFKLLWKADTGGRVRSSCAVAGGSVFAGSSSYKFYALDAKNGKVKWQFFTDDEVQSSPCVSGNGVYFGCDDGKVYALDKNTGKLCWAYRTATTAPSTPGLIQASGGWKEDKYLEWWESVKSDQVLYKRLSPSRSFRPLCFNGKPVPNPGVVRSSPLVVDGKLYVGTGLGEDAEPCFGWLYALDAGTGKVIWKKGEKDISDMCEFAFGISGAPCFENGHIHFSYGSHTVVDTEKGQLLLKGGTLEGKRSIRGIESNAAMYRKPDGSKAYYRMWSYTCAYYPAVPVRGDVSIDEDAGIALVVTGSQLYGVDLKSGRVKWDGRYGETKTWGNLQKKKITFGNLNHHSPAAVYHGKAYKGGGHGIGVFDCRKGGDQEDKYPNRMAGINSAFYHYHKVPWKTFKPIQEFKGPEGFVNTAPAIANGYIFAGSDDGHVYAWDLETGELVWKFKTGDKVRSSPAIAGGKLYIGSDDGFVYCFENQ